MLAHNLVHMLAHILAHILTHMLAHILAHILTHMLAHNCHALQGSHIAGYAARLSFLIILLCTRTFFSS